SDWHHYNLKLKLRGQRPVSESEFERLIGDLDESLSGSDSSESEDDTGDEGRTRESTLVALLKKQATLPDRKNATKDQKGRDDDVDGAKRQRPRGSGTPPLVWFRSALLPENTYLGLYRAIFSPEELAQESAIVDAIKRRQLAPISMPKPGSETSSYNGPHIF